MLKNQSRRAGGRLPSLHILAEPARPRSTFKNLEGMDCREEVATLLERPLKNLTRPRDFSPPTLTCRGCT